MYLTKKIRLLPTKEQEILFWKSVGVARWSYNFFLGYNQEKYKEWLEDNTKERFVKESEVRKYINNVLKKTTHTWLKDVSSNVMKQGVKDASDSLHRFFNKVSSYPKFKSKKRSKPSFYVNYETLKRIPNGFHGEKIGVVKTRESLPKIPRGEKYVNPRITYDGKFWYLSVGYKVKIKQVKLADDKIGIDVGLKDLATVSNTDTSYIKKYRNINKGYRIKLLEKRLKRSQRKLSRKILNNIESYSNNRIPTYTRPLSCCSNIQKQKHIIQILYRKITNIRDNYIHQVTTEIVKNKPSRIVLEDLNIKGLMKNRHLSKSISNSKWNEFRRQIEYKAELYGIEVVISDRFYPSSKTCHTCGHVKRDLKLSDRTYRCVKCGNVVDRDINASINLARYQI
nr:MAG TPA: endonuclease [Caudoviricetes sp.]